MTKPKPDLGYVPADRSSCRLWQPPTSLAQARARVHDQMKHLEMNCRDGIDIRYARKCLDEAVDDYIEFTIMGTVDVERNAAEVKKIAGECAELQAEIVVLEALRGIEDGEPE